MLSAFRPKIRTAANVLAVGGFLTLWLAVWPFWLVLHRYLPAHFPARSLSSPR